MTLRVFLLIMLLSAGQAANEGNRDLRGRSSFPRGFVFGTSSSAYQYEGAVREGGREPSIWDTFTHQQPEMITDRSNGDVAVDSYHRYKEDVKIMKEMGLDAYRFSISWTRILPNGSLSGGVNREGVQYYNKLIDELISKGVRNGIAIGPRAASSWLYIYPRGIWDLLLYTKVKYNNPLIYITENGMDEVANDTMSLEEALEDNARINFHRQHLMNVQRAIREGVDVRGYFAWSLLDNFEWIKGYTVRFGINYVDYKNGLKRYPKKSALWFHKFLKR